MRGEKFVRLSRRGTEEIGYWCPLSSMDWCINSFSFRGVRKRGRRGKRRDFINGGWIVLELRLEIEET